MLLQIRFMEVAFITKMAFVILLVVVKLVMRNQFISGIKCAFAFGISADVLRWSMINHVILHVSVRWEQFVTHWIFTWDVFLLFMLEFNVILQPPHHVKWFRAKFALKFLGISMRNLDMCVKWAFMGENFAAMASVVLLLTCMRQKLKFKLIRNDAIHLNVCIVCDRWVNEACKTDKYNQAHRKYKLCADFCPCERPSETNLWSKNFSLFENLQPTTHMPSNVMFWRSVIITNIAVKSENL